MTDDTAFHRFRRVVAGVLDVDPAGITRATTAADVDGWDSVSHASLIMAVEDAYRCQFPDAEIFGFETLGALFDRACQLGRPA